MTASKLWGLILGLVFVGALVVAGATGRFGDRLPFRSATTASPGQVAGVAPTPAPQASTPAAPPPAIPAPAAQPAHADAAHPSPAPHFDVVRVEPSGEAVLAGKGDPDSRIALLDSGKVVAETRSDAAGNFVVLPPPLKPGSYKLSLRQSASGKPDIASTQGVAVSVLATPGGHVIVSMAQAGEPVPRPTGSEAATQVAAVPRSAALPAPSTAPVPAPPGPTADASKAAVPKATSPKTPLAVGSVALEGSGFRSTGTAAAGAHVEIYLNGAHLAGVVASPEGQWSVAVGQGMTAGHYAVRAEAIGRDGAVVARAEVPFDVPVTTAAAPSAEKQARSAGAVPPPALAGAAPGANPAASPALALPRVAAASLGPDASLDKVETALVASGDNLWKISRLRFGQGARYTRIYAANVAQIRDPKLIYPGQVFVVPGQ